MAEETEVVETEDTIDPYEMTEEQLDLSLAESQKDDAQATEVTLPAKEVEEDKQVATTEQSLTEHVEQEKQDAEKVEADKNAQTGDTVLEVEKLKRQIADKELFNQRLANELGELRKIVQTSPPPPPLDPNDLAGLDPITAVNIVLEHRDKMQEAQRQQTILKEQETKAIVKAVVPEIESLLDDIVVLAKEDGVNDNIISSFRQNPWQALPEVLVNYAKRAELGRKAKQMETEIQSLKKKPSEVVEKIEAAAKGKTLTAKQGQSGGTKIPVSEDQVYQMSEDELDADLAKCWVRK